MARSVSRPSTGRRSGTSGKTSAIRSALGRVMTVSAAAMIATSAPSIGGLESQSCRAGHVARIDVAPQVPLADACVVPVRREGRVVLGHHDVRDAQTDEPDPAPPRELCRHRLADQLRQRIGRLRVGFDRLVDRCEGRRDVERKPEDRLARRPDDAFHAGGRPRPGRRCTSTAALMRKVSPSGRRPGAGMAAKWTTASAEASASWVWPRSVRSVTRVLSVGCPSGGRRR